MLLSRYDAPHTTFRVLYIAIPARNQMNVYMENGLTCILSDVDAHVETRHLLINAPNLSFHGTQESMSGI